jgi:hypothetical protein
MAGTGEPDEIGKKAGRERDSAADPGTVAQFKSQLDYQINDYENSMYHNGRIAYLFKIVEVSLAALVTVLIGINSSKIVGSGPESNLSGYLSAAALVASAGLTLTTGLENFRSYRDNWITYANTSSVLRMIRADFERKTAGEKPITTQSLANLIERFVKTISDSHGSWVRTHGAHGRGTRGS